MDSINSHLKAPRTDRARSAKELVNLSSWLRKARKFRQSSRSVITGATDTTDASTVCSSSDSATQQEKRVRFASKNSNRRTLTRRGMTEAERSNYWYSKDDLDLIRRTSRCTAYKTVMFCPHYVPSINRTLKNAEYLALTMDDTGVDKLLRDDVVIERQIKDMKEWCSKPDEAFRGLENWVSQQHRHGRSELAKESRRMVLEMSRQGTNSARTIATEYKEMATTATILARFLAEADAIAASEEDTDGVVVSQTSGFVEV